MNGTAARWSLRSLVVVIAVVALSATAVPAAASIPVDEPVTTELPAEPPTSANDFFPDERDVTDCIGVLERPGCGSENRGGWRQTLILVAIFAGLGVVFANVIRGVRKNRSQA